MTQLPDVRVASAPPLPWGAQGLFQRVCTSNPFYVLSAGLFLAGLWLSFGAQAEQTWPLMSGLASYTLLLAVTACLLVRFGNVWDDVRTVLLLVVLMFLATSVTFDEVLVLAPGQGRVCYLTGLLLAVAVSEGLLRGIRLRLPAWSRLPYYLILALFFLYPLLLRQLWTPQASEALRWGLFGFSAVAGLVFLTLLPAIRRGPNYVRDNGSPWTWPLYPWTLFGLLAAAVPARAFLLCWSMYLPGGAYANRLTFGPYFLVPFGLAVAVLVLEIGLVSGRRGVLWAALAAPGGLLALALVGHHEDPIYKEFLAEFSDRCGGDPLYLTLVAAVAFYAYAALRRVPLAIDALAGTMAVLTLVGPDTLEVGLIEPWPAPILAAALLQLGLGFWRHNAWRCLCGGAGLVAVALLYLPEESWPLRGVIAFHLALLGILILGAVFTNKVGWWLRLVGITLVPLACLAALFGQSHGPAGLPSWGIWAYPLVMAGFLAAYGLLVPYRAALVLAVFVLVSWLTVLACQGYCRLREVVQGLDYIALSLVLFALALLVSLTKSGILWRWLAARARKVPDSTGN